MWMQVRTLLMNVRPSESDERKYSHEVEYHTILGVLILLLTAIAQAGLGYSAVGGGLSIPDINWSYWH